MKKWLRQPGAGIVLAVSLAGAALGIHTGSAGAQEKTARGADAAAELFGAPGGKETLDFVSRLNQIEAAVVVLSNRLGRMVQQPTPNNSIETRLAELERRMDQLERQEQQNNRRLLAVERKK